MKNSIMNYLRARRWGLTSKPLKEGVFTVEIDGKPVNLAHSTFNTDWMAQLSIETKTILELGSFDGGDGLRFTKAFPKARIISVEADPDRFKIVKKTLENSHAEVVQSAICAENGPIDWFTGSIDGASHAQGSVFKQSDKYKKKFPFVKQAEKPRQIDGIRLDSLCKKMGVSEIDLLHMDIEGAENLALQGLGVMRPKAVFLEMRDKLFVNSPSSNVTDKLLRDMGYDLVMHLGIDRFYVFGKTP
jgi:FkbM family methyltransferase